LAQLISTKFGKGMFVKLWLVSVALMCLSGWFRKKCKWLLLVPPFSVCRWYGVF